MTVAKTKRLGMAPGIVLSGGLHGLLIAMTLLGLPWMSSDESAPMQVTEVSFVSEAELEEFVWENQATANSRKYDN